MNAAIHANISCKKWGTESKEDWDAFYSFHDAMGILAQSKHQIYKR